MSPLPMPSFETKVSVTRSKLCGGAIIEVKNLEQAVLAESAGGRCLLVATSSPAGGRCTSFNNLIMEIREHLSIPVMARVRIGHAHEAYALESIGCQFIDESELLDVANEFKFLNKDELIIPCVCGCQNLKEALRRVGEGAVMIRIQGETSRSEDIGKTVKNLRSVLHDVNALRAMNDDALREFSAGTGTRFNRLVEIKRLGRLPVPVFAGGAGGGIVTTVDAELMMRMGCDGVFVSSEIFEQEHAFRKAKEIVRAVELCRSC